MSDSEVRKAVSITDSNPRDASIPDADSALEKRAVRKMDLTLLPALVMFYIIFIDFTNYGNARVAGLQQDLKLTDAQFQASFAAGFLPYAVSQIPSNLILRRISPAILLPTLLTLTGALTAFHGLVTSFHGLVAIRVIISLVEGPMFPGIVLYLSGFYTRRELSLRVAFFFATGSLSGTFSSLLAAAIEEMDGIGGRAGWAWLFIIEGLATVCMGLAAFFLVPSTPRHSRFLTDQEKDIIMARLERDRPSSTPSDKFSIREVLRSLSSPQVILVFIMQFMSGTIAIGLAVFLPSIIFEMGHSRRQAQLLSAGPPVAGFFVTMITAFWSDHYNSRGLPIVFASTLAVIGFAVYLVAENNSVAYGAIYIMVGASPMTAILSAWMSNNSEPYYRRATSIASGFIATCLGSALSIWLYPSKNGPKYRNTTILNLVFSTFILVASLLNMLYMSRRNKEKENPGYRVAVLDKFKVDDSEDDSKAWMELGDKHPDFRYTL